MTAGRPDKPTGREAWRPIAPGAQRDFPFRTVEHAGRRYLCQQYGRIWAWTAGEWLPIADPPAEVIAESEFKIEKNGRAAGDLR